MFAVRFAMLALAVALSVGSTGCGLLGYGRCGGCGCGAGMGCGADVGCGVEAPCASDCGCEVGGCGVGRSYAGQKWIGDCACEGPKWCFCKNDAGGCGCAGGCESCSEPACGCGDVGCAMEPGCGWEPTCGASPCHCGRCPIKRVGEGVLNGLDCIASEIRGVFRPLFGCGGCDSELYWNEWHNDPPQCCDPCDPCGNWTGPSAGGTSYDAPFEHEYMPTEMAQRAPQGSAPQVARKPGQLKKLH